MAKMAGYVKTNGEEREREMFSQTRECCGHGRSTAPPYKNSVAERREDRPRQPFGAAVKTSAID
jgi:hypothetical protein